VVYAAKSTEDLRGSIGTQISDCRVAIEERGARVVDAEFVDEAVSAFRQSRGIGLAQAISRVGELADLDGVSELWVQHSDRLARGDGKRARHVVEIALWALKANVSVRSVQDPDTFRDLLYAVVTGQRNYEDSKRKGAATAAGKRRAAERGEYGGHMLDGYRLFVEVDDGGHVLKGLELDPVRQPLIESIFRQGLAGDLPMTIAAAVNATGWMTVSTPRNPASVQFSPNRIREVQPAVRWTLRAQPRRCR
jgi:DNA invertase Pin-like site-specific DNA recombinase